MAQTVRMVGLEGVLRAFRELPNEVVHKRNGPIRTALRKASNLIVQEARRNVDKIVATPNKDGLPTESTKHLRKNIISARGKRLPRGVERYIVRVRRKAYPESVNSGGKSAQAVGALLESGTERREPMPWMRPAYEAKKRDALSFFTAELGRQVQKIADSLAAKGK